MYIYMNVQKDIENIGMYTQEYVHTCTYLHVQQGVENIGIYTYIHQLSSNLRPTYQLICPAFPTSRQEVPRFLEQSAVPVVAFLGATFLVAVLSRQFLRVGTAWQKRQKERKAAKVRKIQCLGLSKWPKKRLDGGNLTMTTR